MNITTEKEIMIFAKAGKFGNMYSCAISEKQQNGTWIKSYLPVWFKKDVELPDKQKIKINKAWLKPTKDMKIVLFVCDFEKVDEIVTNETINDDSDLPF